MLPFFNFPSWMTWFASGDVVSGDGGMLLVTAVVLTRGQHALDEVVDITQNDAITFSVSLTLGAERLDLNALQDWHRVFPLDLLFVMEDGTVLRQSRAS